MSVQLPSQANPSPSHDSPMLKALMGAPNWLPQTVTGWFWRETMSAEAGTARTGLAAKSRLAMVMILWNCILVVDMGCLGWICWLAVELDGCDEGMKLRRAWEPL